MRQQQLDREVAWLCEQIKREQYAAQHTLADPKITDTKIIAARRWFVRRRMERIVEYQLRLAKLIGEQAAMQLVLNLLNNASRRSAQAA